MKKSQKETVPLPFNPRSPEFRANPYPTYRYLQTYQPIYYRRDRQDWILTRYTDIVAVLRNPNFGHSEKLPAKPQIPNPQLTYRLLSLRHESQKLMKLWFSLLNPPDHTRISQLFRNSFTQARIKAMRSCIQVMVEDLIDRVKQRGKMDIIGDLLDPLTLSLICNILGIPLQEQHPQFKQWLHDLSLLVDLDPTPIASERGLLAIFSLSEYFCRLIANRDLHLQDHLISKLIQAQAKGKLSEEELIANCIFIFFGGQSSTKHSIGLAILTLLRHPTQLSLLRSDPSLMEMAISELLRYDTSVQTVFRTALCDVQLSDRTIYQNQRVNCLIAAANRDPDQFPNPDKFDIKRTPNPYLSFGQGIHICLGKHLAKLVAEIAVGTLVYRLPGLSLATESLEWEETFLVRGLKSLPVLF